MVKIFQILLILLILTTSSCEKKVKNDSYFAKKTNIAKDDVRNLENNSICNFDRILSNPKTPKIAKDLFYNKANYSEEPLQYFKNIKSEDQETRFFYFRVITNSYKISDGAYSESLGNFGKEFIEENPKKFAEFFDYKDCFNDEDLKIWAQISLLEFEIIDDNIESGKGEPLVNIYCKNLKEKSKNFPKIQKETINKFCNYLLNDWSDFLTHI